MWKKFIAFDQRITATILAESRAAGIPVCTHEPGETAEAFARRVQAVLRLPGEAGF